jgi:23S rRNA pseudouridine1911/1915/1917 synthase
VTEVKAHAPEADLVTFLVTDADAGERVDVLLLRRVPGLGRRAAAELFARKAVRVAGRVVKKGERPSPGAEVTARLHGAEIVEPEPGAPLDVRLETPQVVIVSKPAGQPTAPVRLGERGTLAQALLGRYPELSGIGHRAREPGLLHRLDTHTSGLVIAVRDAGAFDVLRAALSAGALKKHYLAIVTGRTMPDHGVVEAPLRKDPGDDRRVVVAAPGDAGARPARSEWRRVATRGDFHLVEVSASPASRHQVRVHLASIGSPIVGDSLYGGAAEPSLGARHALHASHVAWAGDGRVGPFEVDDALPPDLSALVPA